MTSNQTTPRAGWTATTPSPAGLTITVYGQPAPQGSKRHLGKGVMVESSAAARPWREAVKHAARDAADRAGVDICPPRLPLAVAVTFTVPKPASAPKRRRTWPTRRPDLDKLVRSTLDGLGDVVLGDDAHITALTAAKVYPDEGPDALPLPGAVIHLRPATEETP